MAASIEREAHLHGIDYQTPVEKTIPRRATDAADLASDNCLAAATAALFDLCRNGVIDRQKDVLKPELGPQSLQTHQFACRHFGPSVGWS
ncbi:hypothetical protein [Sphingobium sp.]|uniref:hypothetical protein n=1 Tax=Sphingobium sp. TaxID=1912891 RepID=UPI002C964D43|nr:hypothetical protein [Sphingobium sp.]HUD94918.1 hypothetical protein [Sphingobium sp.]